MVGSVTVCFNYVSRSVKHEVYQVKRKGYLAVQSERQSIFCCIYEAECLSVGGTFLVGEE